MTTGRETAEPLSRDNIASRRTRVRQLTEQGKSLREIAGLLGVGKDTVSRDLAVMRRDAQDETRVSHPGATPAGSLSGQASRRSADPDALPGQADVLLGHPDTAGATPLPVPETGRPVPATGATPRLSLPMSRRVADDLAVLADAGHSQDNAVAYALELLANTYRHAWMRGLTPRHVRPIITRIVVQPQGEHRA